jgi:hypothetical protein
MPPVPYGASAARVLDAEVTLYMRARAMHLNGVPHPCDPTFVHDGKAPRYFRERVEIAIDDQESLIASA